MAHFRGIVQGNRGEATRNGSKASGLDVTAASWQGAVKTVLYKDEETGLDMARVSLRPWHGAGTSKEIYHGPVNGEG